MSSPDFHGGVTAPTCAPRPGGSASLAGRTVSRVGYGAMQLTRLRGVPEQAIGLLRHARALGSDHFDTAQFYGDGLVNALLHKAFHSDNDVVISSKVGADANPGGPVHLRLAQRPEELRASVDDNLKALEVEQAQVMNLRRPDERPGLRSEGDQAIGLDDQLAAMTELRHEGKIGAIGLSNVTLSVLRQALPARIACVQNAYSLTSRGDEDLLALCEAEGIAWVPFFPLGSAAPHLPKVVELTAVQEVAAALHRTPSQVGLAWLLQHSPNVLLIPGTADIVHLDANAAAGSIHLDDEMLASLDNI